MITYTVFTNRGGREINEDFFLLKRKTVTSALHLRTVWEDTERVTLHLSLCAGR